MKGIAAGETSGPPLTRPPAGGTWTHTDTGTRHPGGVRIIVDAPLDRIPLFLRDGARPPIHDPAKE